MGNLVTTPITEVLRGLAVYWQGVNWLRRHGRYFVLLFVPMLLSFAIGIMSWQVFLSYQDQILAFIYFDKPEGFLWLAFYYLGLVFVYAGLLLLTFLVCFLFANVFSSPVYEMVSVAVERDLGGKQGEELTLWHSLLLMKEELKKAVFVLSFSIAFILIPGLNIIAFLATAFLLGWEFYDYPLARRGWSFGKRLQYVRGDFWSVTAFGLWLIIPFVQFFMMPLAVAGGTQLSVTTLKKKNII